MKRLRTAYSDWEINGDGTSLDITHGLMWMRRPMGRYGPDSGDLHEADWVTTTAKYGRGTTADGPSSEGRADLVRRVMHESSYDNGYTRGSEVVRFAGYSDWRLPTLDEVVELTFDEAWGAKRIQSGEEDKSTICEQLFEPQFFGHRYWTATKLHEPPAWAKFIAALFGRGSQKPGDWVVAWLFRAESYILPLDEHGEFSKGALLVRRAKS